MKHALHRLAWLLWLGLFLASGASAQQLPPKRDTYGPVVQGQAIRIENISGSQATSFEYIYSVTPASASITIQGCMRGKDGTPGQVGTCDTAADTYTGTTNSIRNPAFTKVYDTFLITPGTLSAGTTLTVNTTIVVSKAGTSSGGGAGSGTVSANNGSAGAGAFYAAAGGSTTVSPLSGLTYDSVGNATLAQGTITVSTPILTHTGTYNAGGVVFNNWLSNVTCTAAAANSKGLDIQIGGTSQLTLLYSAANCATAQLVLPAGSATAPGLTMQGATGSGMQLANPNMWYTTGSARRMGFSTNTLLGGSGTAFSWSSNADPAVAAQDTGVSRGAAGITSFDTTTIGNGLGTARPALYASTTNCAAVGTAANPSVASCTAAPAGSFSCATNASTGTCVVNTTAVTANSEIFITQRSDTTTGTRLSVTCNTTLSTVLPEITAVTAATSFTINLGTIATNPECFSYFILN